MSECPVCVKQVASLRKHCVGKWLNHPEDTGHLKLAIELTPGASAFLEDIYPKDVESNGDKDRHELPIVRGTIQYEDRHDLPIVRGTIHHED